MAKTTLLIAAAPDNYENCIHRVLNLKLRSAEPTGETLATISENLFRISQKHAAIQQHLKIFVDSQ